MKRATACANPAVRAGHPGYPERPTFEYEAEYLRHAYSYMGDHGCETTGECAIAPSRQDEIVEWHRDPIDGLGGCHYLDDGYRCEGCHRDRPGSPGHGGHTASGRRTVLCPPCQARWLKEITDADRLRTAKSPTAPDRVVAPIEVIATPTLWESTDV